jgi:hypothetical protein
MSYSYQPERDFHICITGTSIRSNVEIITCVTVVNVKHILKCSGYSLKKGACNFFRGLDENVEKIVLPCCVLYIVISFLLPLWIEFLGGF